VRRAGSVLNKLGLLVALSLVAGLLVAGVALPVVGGVGVAVKATNDALAALPTSLDEPPLAQHSLLRAADGSIIATLAGAEDRVIVPMSQIPNDMQAAIVAIEDNRFYEHSGVDIRGLLRAVRTNADTGGFSQGASTITQQYVKLVLLEQAGKNKADQQAATEKSISRKLREARYAIALEKKLTKAQILERYLNIAYFGEGVYGVGTAAQHYFQVPVEKLTLAQSALLAGLVNNPSGFDPIAHPRAAADRRNLVLDALDRYGFLPHAQIAAALRAPLGAHPIQKATDPCAVSRAPFFCASVLRQLLADPKLGPTASDRRQAVYEGGLSITTTWDPRVEAAVDDTLHAALPNDIAPVAGVVVMEPGTGKVLAIGQNRAYGVGKGQTTEVYPSIRGEQVGSTFKAITLAAALDAGLPLNTTFDSPACYIPPFPIKGKETGGSCPLGISNAGDSESGQFNMVNGSWYSVNTYFVQLELAVGIPKVAQMAKRLGIHNKDLDKVGTRDVSTTLGAPGGTSLSVLDMATAYATIAAHGRECQPMTVSAITTLKGQPVDFSQPEPCQQVVDPAVADTVTSILQGVLNQPLATAFGKGLDRPAAGKTGTLDNSKGAWFVGYVPQYVTAIGLWNPKAPNSPLVPLCASGIGCFSQHLYGGDIPAPLWHQIMTKLVQGVPVVDFARPQQGNVAAALPPVPTDVPTTLPPFGSGLPTGGVPGVTLPPFGVGLPTTAVTLPPFGIGTAPSATSRPPASPPPTPGPPPKKPTPGPPPKK